MIRWTAFLMTCAMALAGDAYGQQLIANCPVLPANNVWNTPVDVKAGTNSLTLDQRNAMPVD